MGVKDGVPDFEGVPERDAVIEGVAVIDELRVRLGVPVDVPLRDGV